MEDGRPGGVAARSAETGIIGRIGGEGQIADRDIARLVRAGRGARGVAAQIAEGVELFDKAQRKARLVGHEGAQGELERPVAGGIEGTEGQGGGAVGGMGGQNHGFTVPQGDDHRRQADPYAGVGG